MAEIEALVTEVVDEFMNRVHHGESPDIDDYAARHPAIGKLLRELLPALQVMGPASFSGPGRNGTGAETAVPGCLGDFYILRQIGQGGMGVVYEAEQISLVRRVALKVLPFASTLDAKQLQRFQNEARAAAHLHHPHIVPVYTAGCERGVHYYAMQFIDGQSLAALIEELRQPDLVGQAALPVHDPEPPDSGTTKVGTSKAACPTTLATERSWNDAGFFRLAARWGVQAAQALEHAHQVGIVHRDIKPANLLLSDGDHLWITDFGLARLRGDDGLTMTGDLLGTLRYMSPEQAQAGRNQVDHRTDVYSLGVTLYELVTLQPAFAGGDRHDVLRRIASEEPSAPRRLNPAVPDELEIILLKATAKHPGERYATAQELADDLSRFLEDKPIRARRPSLVQRLRRRLRRHKAVVVSVGVCAAVMLFLAVAGLAVGTIRIAREQAETRKALSEAEKHREKAEANFKKAQAAVDQMLTEVSEDRRFDLPQLEPVRRALLDKALKFYQGFLEERSDDPEIRFETGRAYARVGTIYSRLGQPGPSESAFRQGLDLFEKLLSEFPARREYREATAAVCAELGTRLRTDFGRSDAGERYLRRALELWQKLNVENPDNESYRHGQAHVCHDLGYVLWDLGQLAEAEKQFRCVLVEWDKLDSAKRPALERAQAHNSLGLLLRTKGRLAEAEQAHRAALALLQGPPVPGVDLDYRWELARTQSHLGVVLARRQQFAEGEAAVRQAIVLRSKFVEDVPTARTYRQELALTHLSLGWLFEISGRVHDALRPYREAVTHQEKVRADFPLHPDSWERLALCHASLGQVLYELDRRAEAQASFRAADRTFRDGLSKLPDHADANRHFAWFLTTCPLEQFRDAKAAVASAQRAADAQPSVAICWTTLGMAHYRQGNWKAALTALERALEQPAEATAAARFFLAMTHRQLGDLGPARQAFDQAVSEAAASNTLAMRRIRAEAAGVLGMR